MGHIPDGIITLTHIHVGVDRLGVVINRMNVSLLWLFVLVQLIDTEECHDEK